MFDITTANFEVLSPASSPTATDGDDPIFTPAEVAFWLRTSVDQLRRWREAGDGPHFLDYGRGDARYQLSDLSAWRKTTRKLKAQPATAAPQRGHVHGSRGIALRAA